MGLTIEGAGFVYGEGEAWAHRGLAGVDLVVHPGELVAVLGATGSGKSTLLRLAAGLLAPTEGRVLVDGTPAAEALPAGRVGLVFQRPESQLFAETVLDDVAFGPRNLGADVAEARDAARQALREVGLDAEEFGSRSPFTLSGGEARRAAVAGVLAMRPAYLLLDEPTAGLDANGRDAVLAAVSRVRADTGVVVVTHDPEEFLGEADRVLVLIEGAPSFYGRAAALIADPSALEASGLSAPAVLQTQLLARAAGLPLPMLSLDPRRAAELLADARAARA